MLNAMKRITYGEDGKENGWLMEMEKRGGRTFSYLTAVLPGCMKGFHLHRIREAHYVCLKGQVRVETYHWLGGRWVKKTHLLMRSERISISQNVPTGIFNLGRDEAWIANFPNPPYDPSVKEQVEYTQEELDKGVRH